jgi:hypothetical protein
VKHLTDDDLVRLTATGLTADAREHLDACEPCSTAWAQHEALWRVLGERPLAPPAGSLGDAVMARAAQEASRSSPPEPRRASARRIGLRVDSLLRLAAALVVGVGGGLALERVLRGSGVRPDGVDAPVDGATVARETLFLPQFQNASPGNFAAAVLQVRPVPPAPPSHAPKGHPR